MPIRASATQAFRLERARTSRQMMDERKRILANEHYTPTERARALVPIESVLRESFAEYRRKIQEQIDKATAEYLTQTQPAQLARAAFDNPARAVAIQQLVSVTPKHVRQELAKFAVERDDKAAAYGMIQADFELADALRPIGQDAAESAMADLVGALTEAGRFEMEGAFGDVTERPVEALKYANLARSLPQFGGGSVALSDEQVAALRQKAGLPSVTE